MSLSNKILRYSFELVWGPAKGEETSKPKLIYRDKDQPNYGPQ